MWLSLSTIIGLGWVMAISPCPMATNIAAISFISRDAGSPWRVISNGIAYAVGRMVAYTGLAILICMAVLDQPEVSRFLQTSMNEFLGPLMILVGMVLLELISIPMPSPASGSWAKKLAERGGIVASGILGVIFAMSFCPISAVWYIEMLEITRQSGLMVLLPAVFGITTAVPVVLFAVLMAIAVGKVSALFNFFGRIEKWVRFVCGVIFIAVGILYCLTYIYEIPLIP